MMNGIVQILSQHQPQVEPNFMNILFVLVDDKLDSHYIISENVNNKEEPNQ